MDQIHYAVDIKTKTHRTPEDHERLKVGERLVIADADGWINHDGRGCPLPLDQPVECKDKHGAVMKFSAAGSVIGWIKAVKKCRPILNQEKHVTTTAHENKFGPDPESGTNSTIPPRPFMTGAMKSSFNQPKQWLGPEDGLPPVGCECEFEYLEVGGWVDAKVIGYDGPACVVALDGYGYAGSSEPGDFRPIRTDRERWIAAAEYTIEKSTGEPSNSAHLGLLYDAGLASLPEE